MGVVDRRGRSSPHGGKDDAFGAKGRAWRLTLEVFTLVG